jgi:hypothetical protein
VRLPLPLAAATRSGAGVDRTALIRSNSPGQNNDQNREHAEAGNHDPAALRKGDEHTCRDHERREQHIQAKVRSKRNDPQEAEFVVSQQTVNQGASAKQQEDGFRCAVHVIEIGQQEHD